MTCQLPTSCIWFLWRCTCLLSKAEVPQSSHSPSIIPLQARQNYCEGALEKKEKEPLPQRLWFDILLLYFDLCAIFSKTIGQVWTTVQRKKDLALFYITIEKSEGKTLPVLINYAPNTAAKPRFAKWMVYLVMLMKTTKQSDLEKMADCEKTEETTSVCRDFFGKNEQGKYTKASWCSRHHDRVKSQSSKLNLNIYYQSTPT